MSEHSEGYNIDSSEVLGTFSFIADLFALLDPEEFNSAFVEQTQDIRKTISKEVLLDHQRIWLPGYQTENEDSKGNCIECLIDGEYLLPNVAAENKFHTIVPDIFASRDDTPLMIEIYVTHKITPAKKSKMKVLGVDCLEIDLSKLNRYQDIA